MTRLVVEDQIDRLERLGRERALTKQESWWLQKMLAQQRRIDGARARYMEKAHG